MLNLGTSPTGKRLRKAIYGFTQAEVQAELLKLRGGIATGVSEPSKMLFGMFLERWLEDTIKPNRKFRTYDSYAEVVKSEIIPRLGAARLDKLTSVQLRTLVAEVQKAKSADRAHKVHAICRNALNTAVPGLIPRNPVDFEAPRVERAERAVWTGEEAERFLAVLRKSKKSAPWLYPLINTALMTGARHAELLGLTWDNVDLVAGRISFRKQMLEVDGKHLGLVDLKTKGSARTIDIPPTLVAVLKEYREFLFTKGLRAAPYVFCNRKGGPLWQTNVLKAYRIAIVRSGVPPITMHDLRHTSLTHLLQAGETVATVAQRAGHSNPTTTMKVYAHAIPGAQAEAARKLEKIFGR